MTCLCEKDADGRCPACIEKISSGIRELAEAWRLFEAAKDKITERGIFGSTCDECARSNMDSALAKLTRDILSSMPEEVRPDAFDALTAFFPKDIPTPLIDRVFADLVAPHCPSDSYLRGMPPAVQSQSQDHSSVIGEFPDLCARCRRSIATEDAVLLADGGDPICVPCYDHDRGIGETI